MSGGTKESLITRDEPTVAARTPRMPALPKARINLRWRPQVWMQWLHRWSTLTLGILLVVTTLSGVVTLFAFELNRLSHPQLYHATPSANPISLDAARDAIAQGLATDPEMEGVEIGDLVARPGDSYQFYLYGADDEYMGQGFVDPGTGAYLGHYNDAETIWGWFEELHFNLFAEDIALTYPEWVPEWAQTLVGFTLAELMLKIIALLLLLLVITGAYLWWPGIKKLVYGVTVRRGVKGYAWHYEWHKVLGFVSLPFLFMWAITTLNFYEPYADGIKSLWFAMTLSPPAPEWPEELESTPDGGPMISAEEAKQMALEMVPGARFTSVFMPMEETGTANVWMSQGVDPYEYSEWPGQVNITFDVYSGEVLDDSRTRDVSWGAYAYEWWFYTMHAGVIVSWPVRLIWAFFGLLPTFLAFTGVMQWWLKRQKHKERQARRRASTAPAPAGD